MTGNERKSKMPYGAATRIAEATGRSLSHVSQVMHCERTGRRDAAVERVMARMIGVPLAEAFPPLPPRNRYTVAQVRALGASMKSRYTPAQLKQLAEVLA